MSKNSDKYTPLALDEQSEPFRSEPVKTTQHDSSEQSKENAGADDVWKGSLSEVLDNAKPFDGA